MVVLGELLETVRIQGDNSNRMKYLIASDKTTYSAWQIKALLRNLSEDLGVDLSSVYVILGNYGYNKHFKSLERRFRGVNFVEYRDLTAKGYKPSIKPYLLWKFFDQFRYLVSEQFTLLDPDVIITEDLGSFDKGTVHVSNCRSYMNVEYIESTGWALDDFAAAFGVSSDLIRGIDDNIGGAQYVFDGIEPEVWEWAYRNCVRSYSALTKENKISASNKNFQYWATEMFSVAYAIALHGHTISINTSLDFSFATDKIENILPIIHNAGVTNSIKEELFNKGDYIRKFPPTSLEIDDRFVSWAYYEYVKKGLRYD
jgi:hypothetical protein